MDTSTPTAAESNLTLRAARRLDWRFLLPEPTLRRVAYLGDQRGELLPSLSAFGDAVRVVDPHRLGVDRGPGPFDLLVLEQQELRLLATCRRMLEPGGWLYAEFVRDSLVARPGVQRYARALRAAGFDSVHTYWHWPSFEACTRIVSLDEPEPFGWLVTHGRESAAARLQGAASQLLLRSGLVGTAARCVSVVGQAAPATGSAMRTA